MAVIDLRGTPPIPQMSLPAATLEPPVDVVQGLSFPHAKPAAVIMLMLAMVHFLDPYSAMPVASLICVSCTTAQALTPCSKHMGAGKQLSSAGQRYTHSCQVQNHDGP